VTQRESKSLGVPQHGHGTHLIPARTFTSIQVLNNKNYMQIVAFVNQVNININAQDYGGELDPHE
jgi:hypothetical protein